MKTYANCEGPRLWKHGFLYDPIPDDSFILVVTKDIHSWLWSIFKSCSYYTHLKEHPQTLDDLLRCPWDIRANVQWFTEVFGIKIGDPLPMDRTRDGEMYANPILMRNAKYLDWSDAVRQHGGMIIEYRKLLANPKQTIEAIAEAVGCEMTTPWRNDMQWNSPWSTSKDYETPACALFTSEQQEFIDRNDPIEIGGTMP